LTYEFAFRSQWDRFLFRENLVQDQSQTLRIKRFSPIPQQDLAMRILSKDCFFDCISHSKLTQIWMKALYVCSSFKSLCLPAAVVALSDQCVSQCRSLSSFTLESCLKLSTFGSMMFSVCEMLKSIVLPWLSESLSPNWAIGSLSQHWTFEPAEPRPLTACTVY
jgi:hypothetical protein